MAKSDADKAPLLMVRRGPGLIPAAAFDAERLDAIAPNTTVEVSIKQRRSGPNHRHFFSVLGQLVSARAVPFNTVDELLDALKMACGITELRRSLDGTPYYVPGSISFAAKDEPAFREFKERAFQLVAFHYGVDVDELAKVAA